MHTDELQSAKEIALEAGAILRSYFGQAPRVREKKAYWDLVTEADLASEDYILKELQQRFPTHHILSEEAGLKRASDAKYQWLVDPLDGTTNFVHQYPQFSVSIGLLVDQIPTVGVVYNPIFEELFIAAKGQGATLNGVPLHVSKVERLESSLLATGFAYDRRETQDNNYAEFCFMTNVCQGVRRSGSAALDLAYVAAGRLDGFWERGLQPWDMAAGTVLIAEAKGKISSYENGPFNITSGRILATNGLIHPLLSQTLQTAGIKKT